MLQRVRPCASDVFIHGEFSCKGEVTSKKVVIVNFSLSTCHPTTMYQRELQATANQNPATVTNVVYIASSTCSLTVCPVHLWWRVMSSHAAAMHVHVRIRVSDEVSHALQYHLHLLCFGHHPKRELKPAALCSPACMCPSIIPMGDVTPMMSAKTRTPVSPTQDSLPEWNS